MKFKLAVEIRPAERDRGLPLLSSTWPEKTGLPTDWKQQAGTLRRIIKPSRAANERAEDLFACDLEELMLRFPSAPIHGVQRLHEYHADLPQPETMHTYRLLQAPGRSGVPSRIILMHNGLNERDKARLYYQIASYLIARDERTVCLLRPFPGHLSRFPWDAHGETPLDRYLWDGSHLFRQFLRHMTETQWLLSALVGRSRPAAAAGAPLLATRDDELFAESLGKRIEQRWEDLWRASRDALEPARARQSRAARVEDAPKPEAALLADAVGSLREAIGLTDGAGAGPEASPSLHTIGYSLGGFSAQAVFMTWPSLISSCSTLLSGGPLRALAPTAFAHAEEWQTVLHSLRYELDDGMMGKRFAPLKDGAIVGLEASLFYHFQRAFYEVFQQEYHGSFQSRLAAFRKRMFFVVGGDDPIVSPKAVIESGPAGGINVLEIGGIGHFFDGGGKDAEEKLQRAFWLPQIGRLINEFSGSATDQHRLELETARAELQPLISPVLAGTRPRVPRPARLTEAELHALPADRSLPSSLFGRFLDDLLARADAPRAGFLWIFRNEIPTIMLDDPSLLRRAQAIFHDEAAIAAYCRQVRGRRRAWERARRNVVIVLPWNVERMLAIQDATHGFATQAETSMGPLAAPPDPLRQIVSLRETCKLATKTRACRNSVMVFNGREHIAHQAEYPNDPLPPSLPDCWLWTSLNFLGVGERASVAQAGAALAGKSKERPEDSRLKERIRDDEVRLVTVSRARYNPRFRGRFLLDLKGARQLLIHAGQCIVHSCPYDEFDFDDPEISTMSAELQGGAMLHSAADLASRVSNVPNGQNEPPLRRRITDDPRKPSGVGSSLP